MKRRLLIVLLLSAVAMGSVVAWRWWPRLFPSGEVSELCRRYEGDSHVYAADVRGFRVDDTLRLDATIVRALDTAGWERLKKDFDIVDMPDEVLEIMERTGQSVTVRATPKDHIGAPCDTVDISNNYVIAKDYRKHTIGVFYTRSEEEINRIVRYNINLNTRKNEEKIKNCSLFGVAGNNGGKLPERGF